MMHNSRKSSPDIPLPPPDQFLFGLSQVTLLELSHLCVMFLIHL